MSTWCPSSWEDAVLKTCDFCKGLWTLFQKLKLNLKPLRRFHNEKFHTSVCPDQKKSHTNRNLKNKKRLGLYSSHCSPHTRSDFQLKTSFLSLLKDKSRLEKKIPLLHTIKTHTPVPMKTNQKFKLQLFLMLWFHLFLIQSGQQELMSIYTSGRYWQLTTKHPIVKHASAQINVFFLTLFEGRN